MSAPTQAPLESQLPAAGTLATADELLEGFLRYVTALGLELYPAQEEALLEIFAGNHVILNTPTGSGKSLVALAACFSALAQGKFAFYTAPIKALVSEKFFELCTALGAANVGMMTGDAAVNVKAPIICCTAEVLSNLALREGERAQADYVIMDEFHYYADRDRGVAWQLPLITLPQARFLLMSATLGAMDFFVQQLEQTTRIKAVLVKGSTRPVPLTVSYNETPLQHTIEELSLSGKTPVYIVHFSQRAASEQAQNLMSLNVLSKEEKAKLKEALAGFRFDSPFGKDLSRYMRHGIGVHHAGMLPKYRRLCERLAQQGLLRIICGTDTLGVGVNVPIRTVLFTQLCKFDGSGSVLLSVRDFHQIAGRAGRRGYDTEGYVVVQAPEHEIENQVLKAKAGGDPKKLRKLRPKTPPDRGYVPWKRETLQRLQESEPEPLVSRFEVSHGMLLNVLASGKGCKRARAIVAGSHESAGRKYRLKRQGVALLRSLLDAEIVTLDASEIRLNVDLQQDFSLNQALSLYAVETFDALSHDAPDYALQLLSVVESILENPESVLGRQVARLKTLRMAELKAQGVEYEERIAELEKIEYPKPEADFIYETFNLFAKQHPWVSGKNIAPKSIARDMHEQAASFNDYVKEYGLARFEGVLLRYLTDVYRALRQNVPEKHKTQEVLELEDWLGAELRQVDASLLEEWERLAHPDQREDAPTEAVAVKDDITRDRKAFFLLVRNACWRLVQALARRQPDRATDALLALMPEGSKYPEDAEGNLWTAPRLEQAIAPYWQSYEVMLLDPSARSSARIQSETTSDERWLVRQILSDPEENHDFALKLVVDLARSRTEHRLILQLEGIDQG